jgi:hypothetical protein
MADDLLVGIGVDVAAFRRDRATILSEAQGLQRDIVRALQSTQSPPDLGAQARQAGRVRRHRAARSRSRAARATCGATSRPRCCRNHSRPTWRGSAARCGAASPASRRDFAAEGASSSAAFLSELDRGLADAGAVFAGFSRQVAASFRGNAGILGDLTPQAETAGQQIVTGPARTIQQNAGTLQRRSRARSCRATRRRRSRRS